MRLNIDDGYFDKEERTNTPKRIEKFYREMKRNHHFKFTKFKNPGYDQMILLKDIEFSSICAHHLMPFIGKAHIGYLPDKWICGVSKLARALDKFASRPQLQERLTNEIVQFIDDELHPLGVMVVLEAQHDCMRCRGVRKQNAVMITSAIKGVYRISGNEAKQEFLMLVRK